MKTSLPWFEAAREPGLRVRLITIIALLFLLPAVAPWRLTAQTTTQPTTDTNATAPDTTARPVVTPTPDSTPVTAMAVKVAPPAPRTRFKEMRASGDMSRGVLSGGTVALILNGSLRFDSSVSAISVKVNRIIGDSAVAAESQLLLVREVIDSAIIVDIPKSLPRGQYEVSIELAGADSLQQAIVLERPHILMVESFPRVFLISLIPIILLGVLVWWITRSYVPPLGARALNFLQMLLLEPKNMTYSLSRAQFILWTMVLAGCYVFLFVARGLVESIWTFPPLDGFAGAFLISLGTLLASQATTSVKGVKGAGEQHPAISDLFVHGGVIALERVQQALWTVIAAGMFIYIVFENYAQSTSLPAIPDQLLYLMGISSAGYVTGKAIRNAGPIVSQVDPLQTGNLIAIVGTNLSNDALVWVDGARVDAPVTVVVPDPDKPSQFARALQIAFPTSITSAAQWLADRRCVVVVNDDSQRAEWRSAPKIVSVTAAPGSGGTSSTGGVSSPTGTAPSGGGTPTSSTPTPGATVVLTVLTEYVANDMTWQVTGLPAGSPAPVATRDTTVPNQWNVTIADTGKAQKFTTVVVSDANGRSATYAWQGSEEEGLKGVQ